MAKKKPAGNKSQAIRDALAANPDKGPSEIATMLAEQGFKVNAQYVSTIKSNAGKKSGRTVRVKKVGRKSSGGETGNGLQSAIAFMEACGGLEKAKAVLAQVEQIRSVI